MEKHIETLKRMLKYQYSCTCDEHIDKHEAIRVAINALEYSLNHINDFIEKTN